jgi:murein DD-endopeptidase MepM/ murein hydrolase activator NlpD
MEQVANNRSQRGVSAAAMLFALLALSACAQVEPEDYAGLPSVPRATYFTVMARPGDTLMSIGDRYNVSVSTLEHINNIEHTHDVTAGEEIRIPAGSHRTREAVFHDATTGPYRQTHPMVAFSQLPPPPPPPVRTARNNPAPPIPPQAAPKSQPVVVHEQQAIPVSYSGEHFAWPLSGPIISSFGSGLNGERNDGINIAAKLGEPIHAAASGTVSYAGNELKGYGNLIIIRHDDGYVTTYAHAQSIGVNRGDHVEKGQVIGLAGATGDVEKPQLHFEIRHGVDPVDPRPLLVADSAS